MDVVQEASGEVVRNEIWDLDLGVGSELPAIEEQALGGVEELVLALGAGNGIESPYADNFLDGVTGSVVGIRVRSQDAAEVCLQPQLVGRDPLVAAFVDTVGLHGTWDVHLHPHVQSREGIVAAMGCQLGSVVPWRCSYQYRPETTLCCLSWGEKVNVFM